MLLVSSASGHSHCICNNAAGRHSAEPSARSPHSDLLLVPTLSASKTQPVAVPLKCTDPGQHSPSEGNLARLRFFFGGALDGRTTVLLKAQSQWTATPAARRCFTMRHSVESMAFRTPDPNTESLLGRPHPGAPDRPSQLLSINLLTRDEGGRRTSAEGEICCGGSITVVVRSVDD